MDINQVKSNPIANKSSETKKEGLGTNYDMYLQLLMTQLQNQDPTNPMETKDMVQQMTNLAFMEQVMTMSSVMEDVKAITEANAFTQGMQYLGRNVKGVNLEGEETSGVVTSLEKNDDLMFAELENGEIVRFDTIRGVQLEGEE